MSKSRYSSIQYLFFFLLFISFSNCNKGGGSAPGGSSSSDPGTLITDAKPVDGEAVQGQKERSFFSVRNARTASVVFTEGVGKPTKRVEITNGNLSAAVNITPTLVRISSDEKVLSIKDSPEIFEEMDLSLDAVVAGTELPPAQVETYCTGLDGSGYEEFRVESQSSYLSFVALSNGNKNAVGGGGAVTKSLNGNSVIYTKAGFGTLSIDPFTKSPLNANLFKANFSPATPAPWSQLTTMYCHLNTVPVQYTGVHIMTKAATSASQILSAGGPWGNFIHISAFNTYGNDLLYCAVEGMVGGQNSMVLKIGGYGFDIPATATIQGIQLNMRAKSIGCAQTNLLLYSSPVLISSNKSGEQTWTSNFSHFTYGGSNDNWGFAATPTIVNSSLFELRFQGNSGSCFINRADISIFYTE